MYFCINMMEEEKEDVTVNCQCSCSMCHVHLVVHNVFANNAKLQNDCLWS